MKEPLLDSILRDVDDPTEQETLRTTWNRLEELERAEPSPELAQRFARTIELSRTVNSRPPAWGRRLLPLAAVLVAGVAIGGLAVRLSFVSRGAGVQASAAQAISVVFESRPLASRRLEAVETLAGLTGDPEIGRILAEVASSDPSIGVRLFAIDAIGPYVADDEVARRLIRIALKTDSTLVRIRLIELFVDHRIQTALPEIESFHRDPRADELVRETAQWAIDRL